MLEHYLWFIATNWWTVIITLIVVMILLNFSTWLLEKELSTLWKKLKIPGSVRWATFDAASSSLPEFITALVWLMVLWDKWLEVWIGTIWGSAVFNILIIPAFVLLFYRWTKNIKISLWSIKRDSIFYILSILIFILWIFSWALTIMWIALVLLYTVYLIVLYKHSKKHRKLNEEEIQSAYDEVANKKVNYFLILLSLILIYVWVEAAVVASSWIWETLHISMLVVSLVLLAGITSIPDTLLSVKSAKKWDADAWMGNAVWSNIFDICIWLGLPILIWTLFMWLHPHVNFNSNVWIFIFLFISVIIYFLILSKKWLWKKDSLYLFALYLLFIAYVAYLSMK